MNIDGNTPVLQEEDMRHLGFTDHIATRWYRSTRVGSSTTLNITIDKLTGNYEELVLDECFGQLEFYGHMKPKYRDEIRALIDSHISGLNADGLTLAVDHRLYGCDSE